MNGINRGLLVLVIILLITSIILYARQKRSNVISNRGQQQQPDGIYDHSNQNITINTNSHDNCEKTLLKTIIVIAIIYQALYWLLYFVARFFTNSDGVIYGSESKIELFLIFLYYHNFLFMIYIPIVCFVMNKDFRMSF